MLCARHSRLSNVFRLHVDIIHLIPLKSKQCTARSPKRVNEYVNEFRERILIHVVVLYVSNKPDSVFYYGGVCTTHISIRVIVMLKLGELLKMNVVHWISVINHFCCFEQIMPVSSNIFICNMHMPT